MSRPTIGSILSGCDTELVKPHEAEGLVDRLLDAYPGVPLRSSTRETYVGWLRDLELDEVEPVVDEMIAVSVELPTIAEIRRRVVEEGMDLPDPMDAWRMVSERGSEIHELVKEVVELFGGLWNIRTSESPDITRAQFLKAYDAAREKRLRAANAQRFQRQWGRKHRAA